MVIANGALRVSEGSRIYRRNDGERLDYHEVLNLPRRDSNTHVGGICGLATIKNPNGNGDSTLFVFGPEALSLGAESSPANRQTGIMLGYESPPRGFTTNTVQSKRTVSDANSVVADPTNAKKQLLSRDRTTTRTGRSPLA